MGFFSNFKHANRLRKISESLSFPTRGLSKSVEHMLERKRQFDTAEENLLDFLESQDWMRDVSAEYGVDREKLRNLFHVLQAGGCGQWVRGHYVAASALATPQTLIYLLQYEKSRTNLLDEVMLQLLDYFEKGKVFFEELPK